MDKSRQTCKKSRFILGTKTGGEVRTYDTVVILQQVCPLIQKFLRHSLMDFTRNLLLNNGRRSCGDHREFAKFTLHNSPQ